MALGSQFGAFVGADVSANLLVEPVLALRESALVSSCFLAEATEDVKKICAVIGGEQGGLFEDDGLHRDRSPQIGRFQFLLESVECFGHDSDDGEGRAIDADGFAENGGIG